jgi:glucosamine-6-phosphate deaminase
MLERVPVDVHEDAAAVSLRVAEQIAQLIRAKAEADRQCVLGLATGSTPSAVYGHLVRMHREQGLSFKNVVSFNLDEYYPMQPHELQSYVRFMKEHLFDHVDIDPANVHIPDGTLDPGDVAEYCRTYEQRIAEAGGIDLQLLGIGRTGHIGFNEPGSPRDSQTRMIWLDELTRRDAASDFFGIEYVPRRGITMGVGTILDARRIILMAFGENKAPVIARAVEGPVTASVAASFLQQHPDATFMLDSAAAADLTRFRCPWVVTQPQWDTAQIRKAVIWLARQVDKAILKLTDADYNEHHLQDLLAEHGPAYQINLSVFRALQRRISGWPGGKPESARQPGDIDRPTDEVFPKRVLIFSPHPDDDVISMGGTLIRLVEQGHDVHVAYQTSGNIAVFDDDAIRAADLVADYNRTFGIEMDRVSEIEQIVETSLKNKRPGAIDAPEVQQIKAMIRRGESRAAGRYCGVSEANLHFLDMPFYETGRVVKKPLSEQDVQIIVDKLRAIEPHQIYAAGDLSDPHGTHRTCLAAILAAMERIREDPWFNDQEVWLYRGAWQEWEPHQIDMAVPLSPDELLRRRTAIFKHESQKDKALFPGLDEREFWQRAEDRGRNTATLYDSLGLAEYEAIEGFVNWKSLPGLTRQVAKAQGW